MYDQPLRRHESYQAQRGSRSATIDVPYSNLIADERNRDEIILDIFDELDAKLAAGGDPLIDGPSFEISSPRRST